MKQILVKVRNIAKDDSGQHYEGTYGVESIITYKAYKYTQDKFELLYQCDENGAQVVDHDGNPNPNLEAQHKELAKVKNVVPVAKPGPSVAPKVETPVQAEVKSEEKTEPVIVHVEPEKKRMGRPKKSVELQEHTA